MTAVDSPLAGLQLLEIKDFSAGIVQFGRGPLYPPTFPMNAPLGSAAQAHRVINKAGVGLVPFPTYIPIATTSVPAPSAGLSVNANRPMTITGLAAFGPGLPNTGMNPETYPNNDILYYGEEYWDVNNVLYYRVSRMNGHLSPHTVEVVQPETADTGPVSGPLGGIGFSQTRFAQTALGTSPTVYQPGLTWCDGRNHGYVYISPDPTTNPAGLLNTQTIPSTVVDRTVTHAGRVGVVARFYFQIGAASGWLVANEDMFYTDPPESVTFNVANVNFYNPETFSGYAAYGSVNSGELFLIKMGQGAILIDGDLGFPSNVTKLPGVTGCGRMKQRCTSCSAGMVYVTEYDGVYAWNGSNTSQKVSAQIPDDACLRPDWRGAALANQPSILNPRPYGVQITHDVCNNLVFFPNNWVFDPAAGSWWRCEDTAIFQWPMWARSVINSRRIYTVTPGAFTANPFGTNQYTFYMYDFNWPSSTWMWISNPIPQSIGHLVDIGYVEVVASNPTAVACTITVTPTVPISQTPAPIHGNLAQKQVFTIPPHATAYRIGGTLGFKDYNVMLRVDGASTVPTATPPITIANEDPNNYNFAPNAGPTLHELVVGWAPSVRTGPVA